MLVIRHIVGNVAYGMWDSIPALQEIQLRLKYWIAFINSFVFVLDFLLYKVSSL